jgi:hypothetical protein
MRVDYEMNDLSDYLTNHLLGTELSPETDTIIQLFKKLLVLRYL